MDQEFVILVNERDEEIGAMEKMQAHVSGRLHRALSVFIYNNEGKWLLHKRAEHKYHSAGLWTNTCCSHPRQGESTLKAAHRRLQEEMGMSCTLEHRFSFIYKAALDHELTEHELDHVFVGYSSDMPMPNKDEVSDWRFVTSAELRVEVERTPEAFTEWFKIIYPKLIEEMVTHE
jgi:isopentenyl-diphosphate delta-isomerase